MNKSWRMAIFVLTLFTVTTCVPTTGEPGAADLSQTRTPPPSPTMVLPPLEPADTAVSPPPVSGPLPPRPDAVPAALPVYEMALEPIAASGESALTWAQAFGLADAEVVDETEEMVRVFSRDEAAGVYEELTFLRTTYEQVIVYSSGIERQNFTEPTPLPTAKTPSLLAPETITSIALDFVREHNLLPEPVIAHEFPSYDDHYLVHVAFAPDGFRFTGIGEVPGATVRIGNNGRVSEARIVPASFVRAETVAIVPLDQIYPAFVQGTAQNAYFNERAQLGSTNVADFLRFQAHSQPYGEPNDRIELVYAALPMQPERIVPMWLITRPDDQTWDHYLEYYLLATAGETVPRPFPSPTPLGQTEIEPQTLRIVPPLIVDEGNGRLYTNAAVNGITQTVSLDAATGGLLAVYALTGDLALDTSRNLLYVDSYLQGLTVIDTSTGETGNDIQLPPGERGHARPQADPATGHVLLFRDQMLLVADPLSETWQQTVPFAVEGSVCGNPMTELPSIQQTWFDEEARLLYLTFVDYVCTPWISYTVIVYDLNTMSEVARYPGVDYLNGVAVNGRFYAKSRFRLGKTFQWAWQDGQRWLEQIDRGDDFIGGFSGFQADKNRGWLYEMTVNGFQILDMEQMAVVQISPAPVAGQLVGFDSVTDNLYFVSEEDGRLHILPAHELLP